MYAQWFLAQVGWPAQLVDALHPDFLLDGPKTATGIEVTFVFIDERANGSAVRAGERGRARFLADCATEYYENGGRPVLVKAELAESPSIHLRRSIVQRLLEVQATLPSWSRQRHEVSSGACVLHVTTLPEQVGAYAPWLCLNDFVGWVGRLDPGALSAKTRRKSAKLPLYRRVVDRVILLAVADRTRNSGRLRWADGGEAVDAAGFDEVYLAIYPEGVQRVA